jgi:excisionase family DNA binding protein
MLEPWTATQPLLTPKAAAGCLGVSTDTLRRWADGGAIGYETTPGGHRRYRADEVNRVQANGRSRATVASSLPQPLRQVDPPSRALPRLHAFELPETETTPEEEPQWRFRIVFADFKASVQETLGLAGTEQAGYVSGGCLQFADFEVAAPTFGEAVGRIIDAVEGIAGYGRVLSVARLDVLAAAQQTAPLEQA